MALTTEDKSEIIKKFAGSEGDSGSPRVQVALITARLAYLQEHFSKFKKDHHSRRGLLKLVGRRRSLLDYIKSRDVKEYRALIAELGIRK
jgi:small subunit ribosomal protein S15